MSHDMTPPWLSNMLAQVTITCTLYIAWHTALLLTNSMVGVFGQIVTGNFDYELS